MTKHKDQYKTILEKTEGFIFKDRGSKFLGFAFPVSSEKDIEQCLDQVKEEHPQANHHCFAWRTGKRYEHYRINDDGEPSHSAGTPIFGQIEAFELTEVLIIVVRYFGGTKLGVGGLITAYKTTAAETLKKARIVEKTINKKIKLVYEYNDTSKIRAMLNRQKPEVISEQFGAKCTIVLGVPVSQSEEFIAQFNSWKSIEAEFAE